MVAILNSQGAVIYQDDRPTLRDTVRVAVGSGISLSGANLSEQDLSNMYFRGANLSGADLRGTNLTGSEFTSANLRGVQWDERTRWNTDNTMYWRAKMDPNLTAHVLGADLETKHQELTDLMQKVWGDPSIWEQGKEKMQELKKMESPLSRLPPPSSEAPAGDGAPRTRRRRAPSTGPSTPRTRRR